MDKLAADGADLETVLNFLGWQGGTVWQAARELETRLNSKRYRIYWKDSTLPPIVMWARTESWARKAALRMGPASGIKRVEPVMEGEK